MKDAKMLNEKLSFKNICLINFIIAENLLKKAARLNLTPFEIGTILYRE